MCDCAWVSECVTESICMSVRVHNVRAWTHRVCMCVDDQVMLYVPIFVYTSVWNGLLVFHRIVLDNTQVLGYQHGYFTPSWPDLPCC